MKNFWIDSLIFDFLDWYIMYGIFVREEIRKKKKEKKKENKVDKVKFRIYY